MPFQDPTSYHVTSCQVLESAWKELWHEVHLVVMFQLLKGSVSYDI